MTVYSICVTGSCDVVSDKFTAHSKEIFAENPTQEQIDAFVERCCKGGFINLNKNKKYEIHIVEHPFIK